MHLCHCAAHVGLEVGVRELAGGVFASHQDIIPTVLAKHWQDRPRYFTQAPLGPIAQREEVDAPPLPPLRRLQEVGKVVGTMLVEANEGCWQTRVPSIVRTEKIDHGATPIERMTSDGAREGLFASGSWQELEQP